ncbi:hypothetical protein [Microbacterium sp. cx-59]|uniref:hypothetical protein n=1 Tax=Microbacterium sp. cx-59 TaxID=2891207 RepID=UPI001E2C6201|nr:hypothetical protein [Microbacterium sp. cx-59]MCC4908453.1 hypothetical protein [Microbacterium sp. cx-59]
MSDLEKFTLADLSVHVFASPETFDALYRDILQLLETAYEQSTWELAVDEDVTDDLEHRDTYERLREEAESARGSG